MQQSLIEKWAPVLDIDNPELPKLNRVKRAAIAQILENTDQDIREQHAGMLAESSISNGDFGYASTNATGRAGYDPILIGLVRRSVPQLMAWDITGVQPMSGPTGLVFAMKTRYEGQANTFPEALFYEANSRYSGTAFNTPDPATHAASPVPPGPIPTAPIGNPFEAPVVDGSGNVTATDPNYGGIVTNGFSDLGGMSTRELEGDNFREMSFSIEKTTVTARGRALKAEYTRELAQDLRAIHGLDAEGELTNILSMQIQAEIDREVVHTVNSQAVIGAANMSTAGTYDLISDSQGRWSVERIKGLMLQIEKEANKIMFDTRMGKGNFILCTANVASALTLAGILDYKSGLNDTLNVDVTSSTYAGMLNGRVKVYIDPYAIAGDYITVGFKGTSEMQAGLFYCPYIPVQMLKAVNPDTFQPKLGLTTRYGMVSNPFASDSGQIQASGLVPNHTNLFFRIFRVVNL